MFVYSSLAVPSPTQGQAIPVSPGNKSQIFVEVLNQGQSISPSSRQMYLECPHASPFTRIKISPPPSSLTFYNKINPYFQFYIRIDMKDTSVI
jgi:hypothetical protein